MRTKTWTLEDVSFVVPAGTTTAIVGETGAGKTTLGYLAARLYDVDRGSVSIGGVDIRDLTFAALASLVGVVSQETYLFHASVRENLRFAKPDATDEELDAAAEAARIHHVIAALPEGYDTVVGERGYRFSGGEKQRIAIARTILRNPPILVLDEATSSLDTETERLVQEALDRLSQGRTTIAIAHRLSTVRNAEQIVVLDRGQRRRARPPRGTARRRRPLRSARQPRRGTRAPGARLGRLGHRRLGPRRFPISLCPSELLPHRPEDGAHHRDRDRDQDEREEREDDAERTERLAFWFRVGPIHSGAVPTCRRARTRRDGSRDGASSSAPFGAAGSEASRASRRSTAASQTGMKRARLDDAASRRRHEHHSEQPAGDEVPDREQHLVARLRRLDPPRPHVDVAVELADSDAPEEEADDDRQRRRERVVGRRAEGLLHDLGRVAGEMHARDEALRQGVRVASRLGEDRQSRRARSGRPRA